MTLGKMQNPIRGFLHGSAALAALIGTIYLINKAWGSTAALTGAAIFGVALLVMFTVSTLYHSVPWGPRWKSRFQRYDHSTIYLVVAGTYTPIALATLTGRWLVVSLFVVWGIALCGILIKLFAPGGSTKLSVTLQMVMGWTVVFWIHEIWDRLGPGAILLIAAGGLFYTVGLIFWATKRPKLFARSFSYHELFHVMVVIASALHFAAVAFYAIPATV